jgi:hypothetical protein
VIKAVSGAGEILIVGPGAAKLELIKHAHSYDTKVSAKIVSVETVDHPTDGQVLANARKSFTKIDHMRAM